MLLAYILSISIRLQHDIVKTELISLLSFQGKYSSRRGEGDEEWLGAPLWSPTITLKHLQSNTMIVLKKAEQNEHYVSRFFANEMDNDGQYRIGIFEYI
jgi:hypothetical protein